MYVTYLSNVSSYAFCSNTQSTLQFLNIMDVTTQYSSVTHVCHTFYYAHYVFIFSTVIITEMVPSKKKVYRFFTSFIIELIEGFPFRNSLHYRLQILN